MVIAAHAKRESRHAISCVKSENFLGFQIYKISILPHMYVNWVYYPITLQI